MNKFMIGQYGRFDYNKYHRDYRQNFHGIEACLFEQEEDTQALLKEAEAHKFRIGIHFPLRAGQAKLRDALFMAQDNRVREEAFTYIERELEYLKKVKPDYVLFHYPKPVILDDRVDWKQWRFADPSEYAYESQFSYVEFMEKSERLFQWLTQKAEAFHFTPILEFDALNRYVYEADFLEQLLKKYSKIKLCLDTGRLYLQDKLDPYFDAKKVIRKYAKYAATVHLWNVRVHAEGLTGNHHPVLPDLSPAEGWAPIEAYLNLIKAANPDVKIMFEHRSDLVSDEQLEACYSWTDAVMNGSLSKRSSIF
jgi:sugar phosphate isomerase/epimerase